MDPRPSFAIVLTDSDGVETHHEFTAPRVVIGRHADCDLVLRDVTVSRRHCAFEWHHAAVPPELRVIDLGSGGGVYCNGRRLASPGVVHDGDKLLIGAVIVRIAIAA